MITITSLEAYELLQSLVGKPLSYAIKSPDTDLYDLGFGDNVEYIDTDGDLRIVCEYTLHLTCGIRLHWPYNNRVEFNGDSIHTEFHTNVKPLLGTQIQRIALSDKNDLWIDLGQCYLVIVTLEDGEESWRFFKAGVSNPHLIAADSWIQLD